LSLNIDDIDIDIEDYETDHGGSDESNSNGSEVLIVGGEGGVGARVGDDTDSSLKMTLV